MQQNRAHSGILQIRKSMDNQRSLFFLLILAVYTFLVWFKCDTDFTIVAAMFGYPALCAAFWKYGLSASKYTV